MKRIFNLLLIIVLCFCSVSKVEAADPNYVSIYTNKYTKSSSQPNVMFAVYQYPSSNYLFASPMSSFTYGGETKTPNDYWYSSDDFGVDSTDIKLVTGGKASKIKLKDGLFKNKKFLYYDIVEDGVFTGSNQFYLSDDDNITQSYDMIFEKTKYYQPSSTNSILNEMMCTYGPGEGQSLKSSTKYISIRMVREDGKIKYQVYLDFEPVFEQYQEISEDYEGYDGYISSKSFAYSSETYLKDHFSPRNFWNEKTGEYGCPSNILMGYDGNASAYGNGYTSSSSIIELGWEGIMDTEYTNSTSGILNFNYSYNYDLTLYENASYVEYSLDSKNNSQICVFSKNVCNPILEVCDDATDDEWDLSIQENHYTNGKNEFVMYIKDSLTTSSFRDIYYDLDSGIIDTDCSQLKYVYTNCFNGKKDESYYKSLHLGQNTCVVSTTEFPGSEKYTSNEYLNAFDITTVQEAMGNSNGFKYKELVCKLKPKLSIFSTNTDLKKTTSLDVYSSKSELQGSYNILDLPCDEWGLTSDFTCTSEECKNELEYTVNKQIREILYYCNDTSKNYFTVNTNQTLLEGRYNECETFNKFYESLVANGIISNLTEGCDILSNEFKDKLNLYLNIIKIAAPILAIVLGMLDFTKVLVAGDADKEMKDAWKKFKVRLMAAALLFLVPVLLSTLLNVFIGDDINNNPYCSLFDTEYKY